MQIVIDIPKEKYKDPSSIDLFYMVGAIMNGKPLLSNHGRLIDADDLKENLEKYLRHWSAVDANNDRYVCGRCDSYKLAISEIEDAPTLLERYVIK